MQVTITLSERAMKMFEGVPYEVCSSQVSAIFEESILERVRKLEVPVEVPKDDNDVLGMLQNIMDAVKNLRSGTGSVEDVKRVVADNYAFKDDIRELLVSTVEDDTYDDELLELSDSFMR